MRGVWILGMVLAGALAPALAANFSFGAPTRLTLAWDYERSVAIGDVDGDGRNDLAIAEDRTSYSHEVSVFLQLPDGSLAAPLVAAVSSDFGFGMASVAITDLDGDGGGEVLVGSTHLSVVTLREGALAVSDAGVARYGCHYVVTGDIDGDRKMDAVCHSGHGTPSAATLFYGDGNGGVRKTTEMQTDLGSYGFDVDFLSVRLADVTGDGRPDLLATASRVSSFYVYANNGLGGFFSTGTAYMHPVSPSGVWPAALEVLDIDGDGVNEVVTAAPDNQPYGRLNLYRRNSKGLLALSDQYPVRDSTTALRAGDLDGDGRDELVAGHFDFNSGSVIDFDTDGGIDSQTRFELPGFSNGWYNAYSGGTSKAFALGDLDADGCTDLVAASHSGSVLLRGCEPVRMRIGRNDFDGDGVSDLAWYATVTREIVMWQWAEWVQPERWRSCIYPCWPWEVPPWFPGHTGDFDGDGSSDMFWRNREDGRNEYVTATFFKRPIASVTNQAWEVVATGDFNDDDRSDLLWRNRRTGANVTWNGADRETRQELRTVSDTDWKVAGTGDFDGDGRSEIFWRHAKSGQNVLWSLSGARDTRRALPRVSLRWEVQGIGDFDGDGADDVAWRNVVTGDNTLWHSADKAQRKPITRVADVDWSIGAVGDYDGDGRSDLVWHNRRTYENTIWLSANSKTRQALTTTWEDFELLP